MQQGDGEDLGSQAEGDPVASSAVHRIACWQNWAAQPGNEQLPPQDAFFAGYMAAETAMQQLLTQREAENAILQVSMCHCADGSVNESEATLHGQLSQDAAMPPLCLPLQTAGSSKSHVVQKPAKRLPCISARWLTRWLILLQTALRNFKRQSESQQSALTEHLSKLQVLPAQLPSLCSCCSGSWFFPGYLSYSILEICWVQQALLVISAIQWSAAVALIYMKDGTPASPVAVRSAGCTGHGVSAAGRRHLLPRLPSRSSSSPVTSILRCIESCVLARCLPLCQNNDVLESLQEDYPIETQVGCWGAGLGTAEEAAARKGFLSSQSEPQMPSSPFPVLRSPEPRQQVLMPLLECSDWLVADPSGTALCTSLSAS